MARDSFDNKDEMDAPTTSDSLGNALIYVTTIILVGAFFLMEKGLGDKYNAGMMANPTVAKPATPAPQ